MLTFAEWEQRARRRAAYLEAHPLSSFPPLAPVRADLSSSNEDEDDGEEGCGGEGAGRKRKRGAQDHAREGSEGLTADANAGKVGSAPDKKPVRHKEECSEAGEWRVTVCPKKPVNAYMMWFLENRQDIQAQHAGAAPAHVSRIASQLWKAMPASVKDGYTRRSALALDDFHRDVAAYKQYCAAQGKRPKFSCGGEGKEKVKRTARNSLEEDPDDISCEMQKKEGKKGTKHRNSKHPPVSPWFALILQELPDVVGDGSFQLLEVSSGVHRDGSCKAREWLPHDVVQAEGDAGEVTRFVAASLYPQMMVLPAFGWVPVQVSREVKSAEEAADWLRPSAVDMEEEEDAFVVVVNESQCVAEAGRILTGELEPEPFPAREPPPARQLGTRTVPRSPAEYLLKVERQLLPGKADMYSKFLGILRGFKSQVDGGVLYSEARSAALTQLGSLLQDPPRNQLLFSLAAFLREHPPPGPGGEQEGGGEGDGEHGTKDGRGPYGKAAADVAAEGDLSAEARSVSQSVSFGPYLCPWVRYPQWFWQHFALCVCDLWGRCMTQLCLPAKN